jgi:hypothetical protein
MKRILDEAAAVREHGRARTMKWMSPLAVALLAIAFSAEPAAAVKPSGCSLLAAPTTFVCSLNGSEIDCSWDPVGSAKYSVDTIASYVEGTGTDPSESLSVELSFDASPSATPSITIPLSSFPTDPDNDADTDTLVSVVLRVKALNPPNCPQNNHFSGTQTINLD